MGEPYSGLVLLVDGDAALRRAMRDYLMQSGCAVLEARDAYDALFTCAQYGTAINLMITEINLLPVGGIKLAENALRLWPRLQVLCTSADADLLGVKYWMGYLGAEFLPKPFLPHQLHEKVFSLLGHRYGDDPTPAPGRIPAPIPNLARDFRKDFENGIAPAQEGAKDTSKETLKRTAFPVLPTRSTQTRWDAFQPHADLSKPPSNTEDPLFWLKEF